MESFKVVKGVQVGRIEAQVKSMEGYMHKLRLRLKKRGVPEDDKF